jgi:hypothetical protein
MIHSWLIKEEQCNSPDVTAVILLTDVIVGTEIIMGLGSVH